VKHELHRVELVIVTGLSSSAVTRVEMVGLLCVMDRTHSQLTDAIPETCGVSHHDKDYESVIQQVSFVFHRYLVPALALTFLYFVIHFRLFVIVGGTVENFFAIVIVIKVNVKFF